MVTSQFPAVAPQKPRFRENLTVWFPDAQCDLVISQPALDPNCNTDSNTRAPLALPTALARPSRSLSDQPSDA